MDLTLQEIQTINKIINSEFINSTRPPYPEYNLYPETDFKQVVKKLMVDTCFMQYEFEEGINGGIDTRLRFTEKGLKLKEFGNYNDFINWEMVQKPKQIEQEREEDELRKRTLENTVQTIDINKHVLKTKWLPYWLSGGSLLIAVLSFCILFIEHIEHKRENIKQQERIDLKLQATRNEILQIMDSVYQRKAPTVDILKKK